MFFWEELSALFFQKMLDNSFMPYGKSHFKDAKLAFFLRVYSICWFIINSKSSLSASFLHKRKPDRPALFLLVGQDMESVFRTLRNRNRIHPAEIRDILRHARHGIFKDKLNVVKFFHQTGQNRIVFRIAKRAC